MISKETYNKLQEYKKMEVSIHKASQKFGIAYNTAFISSKLNSGVLWQIEKLEGLEWIEEDQNLVILGNCATGKTSFASHIGRIALEANIKV